MKKTYLFALLKGFLFLILFNVVTMLLLYLLAPTRDNFSMDDMLLLIRLCIWFVISGVIFILLQSHKHLGAYLTYSLVPLLGQAPLSILIYKFAPWGYDVLHDHRGGGGFIDMDFLPEIVFFILTFIVTAIWFVGFLVKFIIAIDYHKRNQNSLISP